MSIEVICPSLTSYNKETGQYNRCGAQIKAPPEMAGKTVRCPQCGNLVEVARPIGTPQAASSSRWKSTPAAVSDDDHRLAPQEATPPAPPQVKPVAISKQQPDDLDDEYQLAPEEPSPPPVAGSSNPMKQAGSPPKPENVMELDEEDLFPDADVPGEKTGPAQRSADSMQSPANLAAQRGVRDEFTFTAPTDSGGVHSGWCEQCGVDMTAEQTVCPSCGYDHSPDPIDRVAQELTPRSAGATPPTPPPVQKQTANWCERCGADMSPGGTVCNQCGHQQYAEFDRMEQEPEPEPEKRVCPKCDSLLPENSRICLNCGFHTLERTRYAELARAHVDSEKPPPSGFQHWLKSQVSPNTSEKNALVWVLLFVGILFAAMVIGLAVLLYLVLGVWALCLLVPAAFLLVAGAVFLGARRRVQNGMGAKEEGQSKRSSGPMLLILWINRAVSWRSLAPPFQPQKVLDVRNTHFNDSDLDSLANLNELEVLDLEGTEITDKSLERLLARGQLKYVVLCDTPVTLSAVWRLQRALPHLWIWT